MINVKWYYLYKGVFIFNAGYINEELVILNIIKINNWKL